MRDKYVEPGERVEAKISENRGYAVSKLYENASRVVYFSSYYSLYKFIHMHSYMKFNYRVCINTW